MKESLVNAFWKRVDIRGDDECWPWIGYVRPTGYGGLNQGGVSHSAHRLSFEIANGKATDMWVLHSCDNRKCVNPRHLREGTHIDNVRDREMRGRSGDRRGDGNNNSKLTSRDVVEMRKMFLDGYSCTDIARLFCVSRATAHRVASGRGWKHIPMTVNSGKTGEEIVVRTFGQ